MNVHAYGEGALFVDLELDDDSAVEGDAVRMTHAVAAAVRSRLPDVEVVAGAGTLALVGIGVWDDVESVVASALRATAERSEPRLHRIEVVYDGADLAEVAERTERSIEEVIEAHAAREYTVELVGFLPGFAYLGPVDERLVVPRRDAPRPRVPAGTVAIAGRYTGVYPFASPGGWQLLGRAIDAMLFDPARSSPALLEPGDRVRFVRRSG